MKKTSGLFTECPSDPAEASMIPVARTAICYSVCSQGSVTDVHVMNMDDVRIPGSDEDRIWSRPLMSTTGCCYTDWMKTHALTPEFVFSELLVFFRARS